MYNGPKSPDFCIYFGLALHFSPNSIWFAGERYQRQRPLPLTNRNKWVTTEFSPTTSLLHHCPSQRGGRWSPKTLWDDAEKKPQDSLLIHHIQFHQFIFRIYFPMNPRVELQTNLEERLPEEKSKATRKSSRSVYVIGQGKYRVTLHPVNYLQYFSLLNLSKHSTCIQSTPGVLTVYCKIKCTIALSWNI